MPGNTEECSHLLYYYSYYCAVGGWICMQGGIYFKYFFEFGPELKRILEMDHFQQLHIDVREQLLSIKSMFDALFILYIISFALGSSGAIVRFVAICADIKRYRTYAMLTCELSWAVTTPPMFVHCLNIGTSTKLIEIHYPEYRKYHYHGNYSSRNLERLAESVDDLTRIIWVCCLLLTGQMVLCLWEVLYPCDHCTKEYENVDNTGRL